MLGSVTQLRLQTVQLPPAAEWKVAYSRWCAFRIIEGQGFWLALNEQKALSRGDVGLVRPSAGGTIRASQLTRLTAACFFFAPALLEAILSISEARFFQKRESDGAKEAYLMDSNHPAAEQFARVCNAPAGNNFVLRGEMLATIGRIFAAELTVAPPVGTEGLVCSKRIRHFLNELTAAEVLRLTPEGIAARCRCRPRRFSNLFKGSLGRSFTTLKKEIRLLRARDLLTEPGSDIDSIARDAGYETTSAFTAMFKKQFSIKPAQWREAAAKLKD